MGFAETERLGEIIHHNEHHVCLYAIKRYCDTADLCSTVLLGADVVNWTTKKGYEEQEHVATLMV